MAEAMSSSSQAPIVYTSAAPRTPEISEYSLTGVLPQKRKFAECSSDSDTDNAKQVITIDTTNVQKVFVVVSVDGIQQQQQHQQHQQQAPPKHYKEVFCFGTTHIRM
jgi:hypothetical protein